MKNDENLFCTSDFALVTTLSLTFPIEKMDKTNPRRSVFKFVDSEDLQAHIMAYWNKELRVEPVDYFNQIRVIKSLIYEK